MRIELTAGTLRRTLVLRGHRFDNGNKLLKSLEGVEEYEDVKVISLLSGTLIIMQDVEGVKRTAFLSDYERRKLIELLKVGL